MAHKNKFVIPVFVSIYLVAFSPAVTQNTQQYSPYLNDDFPNQVFFGDTHLHTSFSADAGMIGNSLGPEEAYRFALGEEIISSTGVRARIKRPLDFLVIADHAENLGLAPMIAESNPLLLKNEFGREAHDLVKAGKNAEAFDKWRAVRRTGRDPMGGENEIAQSIWKRITGAAEKYNRPGKFTALIGYEWTSVPGGNNLHRNVIFRDGRDKADQIIPFSAYDSENPEDLWKWMEAYETNTGGKVLAIPHNGNVSNGLMFDDTKFKSKKPLDRVYAENRARWEPVYEVTQMKGDGEAHPKLSKLDEFADFENWDVGSLSGTEAKKPKMLPREYARAALKRGLAYHSKLGANPFKFGMIGSTDAHTSLATTSEDNYFGKVTIIEPSSKHERLFELVAGRAPNPDGKDIRVYAWQTSSAGLAGVWARENTREALWDAIKRREVFATTGTRLRVRLFAGWNFIQKDLERADLAKYGYKNGVPMGGELKPTQNSMEWPTFLVQAIREADGANLDRIQIIKGWIDNDGKTQEKIFDLACSDGRVITQNNRCNKIVGNTVDPKNASYSNSIGSFALNAYWKDPEFKPNQYAFYYVRVLEIPTPRWTTFDAKIFGVKIPDGAPVSIQERAYTSPIWYTPLR